MNWVEQIPYGLVLCRVDGEEVSVTALSEQGLRVRRIGETPIRRLALSFLRKDFAGYDGYTVQAWRVRTIARGRYACETEIMIAETGFRDKARAALKDYARYIRLKAEGDDEYLAHELTGTPYAETACMTFEEQKRKWFSSLDGFPLSGDWELALALDRPERIGHFLREDAAEFQKQYLAENGLSRHALLQKNAARVYVGNECCLRLCPNEAEAEQVMEQARRQGLKVTAVLPPVRQAQEETARRLVEVFRQGAEELVVNDIGSLRTFADSGLALVMGIHLGRRRKDPRMVWQSGDKAILSENCTNSDDYLAWMAERGVKRVEYETCGYPIRLGKLKKSVHFPFYQTNTSHDCPLAAACLGRDAGRSVGECGRVCEKYARLYADELGLVGRYNSLFGLDQAALAGPERLGDLVRQGADRLVLGLL